MIYVFLDTCIYSRMVTQGKAGSTLECFEDLKKLAEDGKVRVVVPEVVLLEFDKFCRELDSTYSVSIEKLKKEIESAKIPWNEIEDVRQSVISHLESEVAKKKGAFPDRINHVRDWIGSDGVVRVPFDADIWLLGKRRLMSGRMPPTERKTDQDSCIVESLVKVVPRDGELYFASENAKDFAVDLGDKGHALHPLLAEDLPKTRFFVDLCSLVEGVKSGSTTPEATDEEVQEAARNAGMRPRFLTALQRIRPLVENFLESFGPGEENCIRNPRFERLSHEFSKARIRECLGRRYGPPVSSLCRAIDDTLTEMVKHNSVIEYGAVRMKHDTTSYEVAMERLASQFLDLHDTLLEVWDGYGSGQ